MSNHKLDALTTLLHGRGESTEVEYFGQSEFVIGRRLRRREFEVVYRQDGNEVVIADVITREGCDDVDAVSAFIRLIHWVESELPDLYRVRGLFVRSEAQPQLNQVRERLSRVLERKGAHWQMIEGDAWLVYPLQAARDNRH